MPVSRRLAVSVTVVTLAGHLLLGFEQAYLAPVVGVLTGVTAELALETVRAWTSRDRPRYLTDRAFLLPSYAESLLCAMLLYGQAHLAGIALAALVGVASRHVLRAGRPGTPFVNPVALGVTVAALRPGVEMAPPYQFTAWVPEALQSFVPLVLLALGMTFVRSSGRLPLVLAWAGGVALTGLVAGPGSGPGLGHGLGHGLLAVTDAAFVLHTCFVLPEARTTPSRPREQVVFGLSAAVLYLALPGPGPMAALLAVCALRGACLAVLGRRGQPMPGPTRSRTRSEPSRLTSLNAPEARARR
ncbi:hypothetical protein ABT340_34755 [Streptosporangium sp. NPDC000239]|uniref:hypothetical protein n=1 Tax=Streptosporangium sp. NPDC000239 TaxID=3154248 RepID=UPI00332BA5A0